MAVFGKGSQPSRPRDAIAGDFLDGSGRPISLPQSVDQPLPGAVQIGRFAELIDLTWAVGHSLNLV